MTDHPLVLNEIHLGRRPGGTACLVVPTSALFGLDSDTEEIVSLLRGGEALTPGEISEALAGRWDRARCEEALEELSRAAVVVPRDEARGHAPAPLPEGAPIPLTALVLHVTHACNLRCTYCYAGGGTYGGPAALMDAGTARRLLDFLVAESGDQPRLTVTFFGGEPLLNFPVIREAVEYGERRGAQAGKRIRYSLTTNGTLLTEEIAQFCAEHRIGVTVSLDGPPETNDRARPFASGRGSYEAVMARVAPALRRMPLSARVTLVRPCPDVEEVLTHLFGCGFREVGLTPATTRDPDLAFQAEDLERMYAGLAQAAEVFLKAALRDEFHGFTNILALLRQIHEGDGRGYPCGAGIGMAAADPWGSLFACHRFVGMDGYALGGVEEGWAQERREAFRASSHVAAKEECRTCWARYLCSGGCHYLGALHHGDHRRPYAPYCDHLRAWFDLGLRIYAEILEGNPRFLARSLDLPLSC